MKCCSNQYLADRLAVVFFTESASALATPQKLKALPCSGFLLLLLLLSTSLVSACMGSGFRCPSCVEAAKVFNYETSQASCE